MFRVTSVIVETKHKQKKAYSTFYITKAKKKNKKNKVINTFKKL